MNSKVDEYLLKAKKWKNELTFLRNIVLDCLLIEELKWRQPCYTYNGKNVVLIAQFKDYCALTFFKGSHLLDAENILRKPGDNTQESRLIRFTSLQEIIDKEAILKAYIIEAIEVEKAGVKTEKANELVLIDELKDKLAEDKNLHDAFYKLTPGRQRAYNIYFEAALQSKTRISRIEKYIPRILIGKGFNDCVCGLSKKMPTCDGSHKFLAKD